MVTRVELTVWENEKCCFHGYFKFFQIFTSITIFMNNHSKQFSMSPVALLQMVFTEVSSFSFFFFGWRRG